MKGVFIPEITVEEFRNASLESVEQLMAEGTMRDVEVDDWVLCSERMPEEHEWIGTKSYCTTISDKVYVTFERPDGKRFVKDIMFQNGRLSTSDQMTIDTFNRGAKPIAWKPKPEPYKEKSKSRGDGSVKLEQKTITERIGRPAVLEQLAEECTELAQAALKLERLYRGENPTRKTEEECIRALNEEAADVLMCMDQIRDLIDEQKVREITERKMERWAGALDAMEPTEGE